MEYVREIDNICEDAKIWEVKNLVTAGRSIIYVNATEWLKLLTQKDFEQKYKTNLLTDQFFGFVYAKQR